MALIEIENIEKHYGKNGTNVKAVSGISTEITFGEFIAVLGHSGSGKSTLLTMIGGLNHPTRGNIRVDDLDIYALNPEQRADFRKEYIGFVFQAFYLIPYLTVLENVLIPFAISDLSAAKRNSRAMQILEKVGMADKADRLPDELSGGEQERVAIARALVNEPPIILADEPTGNLDSVTSAGIMQLFADLHREGQTIIMVTHNQENLKYASRTISMKDGRIDQLN